MKRFREIADGQFTSSKITWGVNGAYVDGGKSGEIRSAILYHGRNKQ